MELDNDYKTEITQCESPYWHSLLCKFKDANLYQTWPYYILKYGRKRVEHIILKKSEDIVAAAVVRLFPLPVIKKGIAYIVWGPMWRGKNTPSDPDVFRQILRAMRNEYSLRRGLVLRIYPVIYQHDGERLEEILEEEGYVHYDKVFKKSTLIMNLNPPLEEIRADLLQKWRNCLNKAEKIDQEIIQGDEAYLFDEINKIYMEMVDRKELDEITDINHLKKVQSELPPEHKMRIILCKQDGNLCYGGIFSAMGNMGVDLVAATSSAGMKTNASYLVQWAYIKWLKENGFEYYDLNGINRDKNPGGYRFKSGLAGKKGIEAEYIGKYQAADNRVNSFIVTHGEAMANKLKSIRSFLKKNK